MKIQDAIRQADTGGRIQRGIWRYQLGSNLNVIPTESEIILFDGDKFLANHWDPNVDDIMSNDWIVYEGEYIDENKVAINKMFPFLFD